MKKFNYNKLIEALNRADNGPNVCRTGLPQTFKYEDFLEEVPDDASCSILDTEIFRRDGPPELTAHTDDEGTVHINTYVKPVLPVRKIILTSILTPTGASFKELTDEKE